MEDYQYMKKCKYLILLIVSVIMLGNGGSLFAQEQVRIVIITGVSDAVDSDSGLFVLKIDTVEALKSMINNKDQEAFKNSVVAGDERLTIASNTVVCILKLVEDGDINRSILWLGEGSYFILFGYESKVYISKKKVNIKKGSVAIPLKDFELLEIIEE